MIEIWGKRHILTLKNNDIEQWFDVLDNGLVEDRGYQVFDSNLDEIKQGIKNDYIDYLMNCVLDENFQAYFILRNETNIIVSVCRIVTKSGKYYLEGLETHRDYYCKGYASKLLIEVLHELKRNHIQELYSVVRNYNVKSLNFHKKQGFMVFMKDNENTIFYLKIASRIRKELFDHWAKNYNKSVFKSEEDGTYPFAGYSEVKYRIIDFVTTHQISNILEMGIGTGEITKPLYDLGYQITGIDLSSKMIEIAKDKMQKANFILGDFQNALTQLSNQFDCIVFSYSIHHLSYEKQIDLLIRLYDYLNEDGMILIGDVSTATINDMKKIQMKYADVWDDEEYYPISEKFQTKKLIDKYNILYTQINEIAGLYFIRKK